MSVRLDAVGDVLNRTANLPSLTAFTVMGVDRIVSDLGSGVVQPLLYMLDGSLRDGIALAWNGGAGAMALVVADGGAPVSTGNFASRPAVGTDFVWYVRCSGTGTNLVQAGWRAIGSSSAFLASATLGTTIAAPATMYFGGVASTYYSNRRVQNRKVWDRALTDGEIDIESYYEAVKFPASLNCHFGLASSSDTVDRSGNGRNLTTGGTLTTEDGVRLWRPRLLSLPRVPAANDIVIPAGFAAVTTTGLAATVRLAKAITANAQSLSAVGQGSTVKLSRAVSATAAALSISALQATVGVARVIPASVASVSVTGLTATLGLGFTVPAASASLVTVGLSAQVKLSRQVSANAASLAAVGASAQVRVLRDIPSSVGVLSVTGLQAVVHVGIGVGAALGALTITGLAAQVQLSRAVQAASAALVVTGEAATAGVRKQIDAAAAAVTLATFTAAIGLSYQINAGTQALGIEGLPAEVTGTEQPPAAVASLFVQGLPARVLLRKPIPISYWRLTSSAPSFMVR